MKSVLITGSSGLVGSAIKKVSEKFKGYNFIYLTSKECDLTDFSQTLKYFNTTRPDVVIHLAACVGGLFKNMNEKVKMLEDNVLINTNVLRAAYQSGVEHLVACLSTCIFPDNLLEPSQFVHLNESMIHNGPPHYSNEGYAYAKRLLEVHCKVYRQQFGKRYYCVIPTNIYGPHDNFHLEDAHVIPALIHRCYLSKQSGIPFEIKGTGKPLRQFIYSEDLAELILKLLQTENTDNIILADSREYSIKNVAEIINSYFGNELVFNKEYSDGQYRKTADNSLLTSQFNFEFTDLNKGIEKTVKWFIENYNTLRK